MKHLYLFISAALLLIACSRDDDKFDPSKPKNGQVVELFIDHYTTGWGPRIFLNTNREELLNSDIHNLPERQLGYSYVIRAKVLAPSNPPMDGYAYTFDYITTIRKDKYEGQDTLALPMFYSAIYSIPVLLRKEAGQYYYADYPVRAADAAAGTALDSAIRRAPQLLLQSGPRSITLYAKHDPENFGNGYVVYRVAF